jgi:hypothetical protein
LRACHNLTGIIIQKVDSGLLSLPNDLRFKFEKTPTNLKKTFLGVSTGASRSCFFDEKEWSRKIS